MSEDHARRGIGQTEKEISTRDTALKLKSEVIPENMREKMIAAAESFVNQYAKQGSIDMERMLKSIEIF